MEDQEAANKGATGGVDAYANALKGLSPAAQAFVKYLVGTFIPALKKLRDAAAEALLPLLQNGLEKLRTELFGPLEPMLAKLATSIGTAFNSVIDSIVKPENIKDLEKVFEQSGYIVQGLGKVIGSTYDSILSVLVAADPLIRRFTDFLTKKSADFAKFLNTAQANGKLEAFFTKAGNIAAQLSGVFGNLFSGISNVISANFEPGGGGYIVLDWLEKITSKFEAFSGSVEGKDSLANYFKGAATNSIAILESVGAFVKEILKVGADPNVKIFWDTLKEGAPIFGDILKSANEAGPSLARLVVNILKFTKATTDAGAIKVFFNTLNTVLEAINTLLENKFIKAVFNATGKILAFGLALGTIGKVGKFGTKVVESSLRSIGTLVKAIVPAPVLAAVTSGLETIALKGMYAFDAIKKGAIDTAKVIGKELVGAFKALGIAMKANPLGVFLTVVGLVIAAIAILYANSETFRNIVNGIGTAIKNAFSGVIDFLKNNWPMILAILTGPFGLLVLAVVKNFDQIVAFVKGIPTKLKDAAVGMWTWITDKFSAAYTAVQTKFTEMVNWVKSLPARIAGAAVGLWDGFKNGFRDALNWIIARWNSFRIDARFPPDFIIPFLRNKGFTLDTPNIPQLAFGGIVSPSPGGTIARIAEAGKPERVEPLDPQGLSKRDRAMIQMLAGGTGGAGNVINVYPSQGMNESELASIISRQIAFQLRRGGA